MVWVLKGYFYSCKEGETQMSGKVSSDLSSAHAAVSQFSKGEYSSQQFSLGESNIVGMKNAVQLSNSIIGDLAQL